MKKVAMQRNETRSEKNGGYLKLGRNVRRLTEEEAAEGELGQRERIGYGEMSECSVYNASRGNRRVYSHSGFPPKC
ncbi:hypothetical protein L195_g034387 [Trifolium pratense]|uniref:Uncharacterized protein n=1 Tax=Trifolium pratense TaxID=57577 RepID=A0A2K3LIR5_TRIPR|nr:hypothetical protein L195_g034387 [Trifolium pratense]